MPNTIAEYYSGELLDWNRSIILYNKEMNEFTKKFAEVIRRNSITGIAKKVEAHQTQLNRLSEIFYQLQIQTRQQGEALKTGGNLIDDSLINKETEHRQVEIRNRMQETVKAYIEVKFACQDFLSGTLKK